MAFSGRLSNNVDSTLLKWSYLQKRKISQFEPMSQIVRKATYSSAKECHLYGYKTYSEVLDSSSFLFKYALASLSLSEFNKSSLSSPIFKALLPNNLESVTLASSPWQLIVWSAVRNCGLVRERLAKCFD